MDDSNSNNSDDEHEEEDVALVNIRASSRIRELNANNNSSSNNKNNVTSNRRSRDRKRTNKFDDDDDNNNVHNVSYDISPIKRGRLHIDDDDNNNGINNVSLLEEEKDENGMRKSETKSILETLKRKVVKDSRIEGNLFLEIYHIKAELVIADEWSSKCVYDAQAKEIENLLITCKKYQEFEREDSLKTLSRNILLEVKNNTFPVRIYFRRGQKTKKGPAQCNTLANYSRVSIFKYDESNEEWLSLEKSRLNPHYTSEYLPLPCWGEILGWSEYFVLCDDLDKNSEYTVVSRSKEEWRESFELILSKFIRYIAETVMHSFDIINSTFPCESSDEDSRAPSEDY